MAKVELRDSYETPLCELTVDSFGRTQIRHLTAGPGAATLLDLGMIENAMLFHPPHRAGDAEWTSPTKFSMGFGGFVTGDLKYVRTNDPAKPIDFSGVLLLDGEHQLGIPVKITHAKYELSGKQIFDPALQEWTSGAWTINVAVSMLIQDRLVATGSGVMKLRHSRIVPE